MHNLLFCAHKLCMNYVTNTLLLVSSSVRSKQLLCFVHCQGQKSEQKHTTKKFVGFHNHSPLLTMFKIIKNSPHPSYSLQYSLCSYTTGLSSFQNSYNFHRDTDHAQDLKKKNNKKNCQSTLYATKEQYDDYSPYRQI